MTNLSLEIAVIILYYLYVYKYVFLNKTIIKKKKKTLTNSEVRNEIQAWKREKWWSFGQKSIQMYIAANRKKCENHK